MHIEILDGNCIQYALVGSRVTCNPAPTDTDQDVLVLTDRSRWASSIEPQLLGAGYTQDGSDCGDQGEYLEGVEMSFQSFKLDDMNLIITFDPKFYQRFMAATGVAKQLNLLDKADRITLFQAVLYGNSPLSLPQVFNIQDLMIPAPKVDVMRAHWITFDGAPSGCVEATTEAEARSIGEADRGATALTCESLPYPAEPRINKHLDPKWGACPSFCYSPNTCKGSGCCPQSYSCTE